MNAFFVFQTFLIIGLCNSFANSLFSATTPEFSKKKKKKKKNHYQPYSGGFAILNAFSCHVLSAIVLLGKSLKSP